MPKYTFSANKASFEWLQSLISNTYNRSLVGQVNNNLLDSFPYIEDLYNAFGSASVEEEPKPRQKRTKDDKEVLAEKVYTCSSHATYHGKRTPRTDCDECWELYGTLNGLDTAKHARQIFRKKKKSEKTA